MAQVVRVRLEELEQRGRMRVETPSCPVLVALVEGRPYAVEDACRHRQASLLTGVVRDGVVTCPSHFWQYDLRTGSRVDTLGEPLPAYPVTVVGDEIEIEVPDPAPVLTMREILLAHAREGRPTGTETA
ncbi:MAG: Rieske 2Fe-2S domain-containing protein [Actinobacteria bacterium]|jgi:nitrite reductase/ring-hydroxylating ferredoxin subunit|nr:Rieske 2Fe-2S domain-containing protein [Actinomycetota bacterium]